VTVEQGGAPVTDASVNGEFFMPVMESMGRTPVAFKHEGNGRYTGAGNLTMAGAWQVTVTAKRGGETLATRTFNLTTKE
jgi:nitrogen fixation protein FixH